MCWLKQALLKDLPAFGSIHTVLAGNKRFYFQGVGVCLVCAKHSAFFLGHNSVEHNIFFQRVSGFVTWLLAIPRHDLMLAFLRSSFLLAILPKRSNLWRNCWCLDRFFHFSIKSPQLCQCCSSRSPLRQMAFFVWLLGLVRWPDCSAVSRLCYFFFFFLEVHTWTTTVSIFDVLQSYSTN